MNNKYLCGMVVCICVCLLCFSYSLLNMPKELRGGVLKRINEYTELPHHNESEIQEILYKLSIFQWHIDNLEKQIFNSVQTHPKDRPRWIEQIENIDKDNNDGINGKIENLERVQKMWGVL